MYIKTDTHMGGFGDVRIATSSSGSSSSRKFVKSLAIENGTPPSS